MIRLLSIWCGAIAMLGSFVLPAEAFEYSQCMETGADIRYETMRRDHWKDQSKEWRARVCSDAEDELRAIEAVKTAQGQRRAAIATERNRSQARMNRQQECARFGTCESSSADVLEQINRSKADSQGASASGRLSEARNRLVMLEEVKDPPTKRQPELSFDTDPISANRYVQIANQIHNFTPPLFKALNYPKVILPTHWDNFEKPYSEGPQDLRAIFGDPANLDLWVKEAKQVSPKSKIVVMKFFEAYAA